jgi:hypothetical protein
MSYCGCFTERNKQNFSTSFQLPCIVETPIAYLESSSSSISCKRKEETAISGIGGVIMLRPNVTG